jgi:hypothetical protein
MIVKEIDVNALMDLHAFSSLNTKKLFLECNLSVYNVAYLLKARTVETETQPLLGNAHTQI